MYKYTHTSKSDKSLEQLRFSGLCTKCYVVCPAKPFFEFSTFESSRSHQHGPEIILPSPFRSFITDVSDGTERRNGAEIHRYSSITLAGKNRFRNKTDTIPANNFDHGCTTGGGEEDKREGGFYVGIIYRSKAFMENGVGRRGEEEEGETGRIDVKSSGDLRRFGEPAPPNSAAIAPNTGSTNPRRGGAPSNFRIFHPGKFERDCERTASPRLNLCQV